MLLCTGEPGIGKTRLAGAIAERGRGRGARVAWGRSWEALGAPAFWPFIEIFRELGIDDLALDRVDHARGDDQDARFRALDIACERLAREAARGWLLLVLDDLHAADTSSLLLLQLLARRVSRLPLMVVGTYREAEVRCQRELSELLGKIARDAELEPLARLSRADVVLWVTSEAPEATASMRDELARLTEGNPLFVVEVLRLGPGRAGQRLPDGLMAALDQRLGRLSEPSRDLLRRGAVLGRELALDDLVRLGEHPRSEVERWLSEAEAHGIVEARAPAQVAFSHVLFRERLLAELPPERRAALNWRVGELLLADPIGAQRSHHAAAHHLIEGAEAGDPHRAAEVAITAARRALTQLAFEDAAELARRALRLLSDKRSETARELWLLVAEALMRSGHAEEAQGVCVDIAALARAAPHGETLARAALLYGLQLTSARVDRTMLELLRSALEVLPEGDSPLRARVLARYAAALVPPEKRDDIDTIRDLSEEARAMATRVGDPATQLFVAFFASSASGYMVGTEERFARGREIITLASALDDRPMLVAMLPFYLTCLLERGLRAEAAASLASYEDLMEGFPQPHHRWRLALARASFPALEGDFERALALAAEVRALADEAASMPGRVAWMILRVALAAAAGGRPAVDADELLGAVPNAPPLAPFRAWVLAASGRTREAREYSLTLRDAVLGFPGLVTGGATAALTGDVELAARLYPALEAERDRNPLFWGPGGTFAFSPTGEVLGDMARLLGRPEAAGRHYRAALEQAERMGATPFITRAHAALERLGAVAPEGDPLPPSAELAVPTLSLEREGRLWTLKSSTGATVRLVHGKGVSYLACLLEQPGTRVHVLELIGAGERASDAGAVLDAASKRAYRRRLEALAAELDEAESFGDGERARRAREETEALAEELARAVGLGGRDRRAASNVERARVNVQRRLKHTLQQVVALDPALGRYLGAAVRTGTFCSFEPV